MDQFYKIAADYFNTFEGRHLYPRLFSWSWLLWLCALLLSAYSYWQYAILNSDNSYLWLVASFFLLGYASLSIQEHKAKQLIGTIVADKKLYVAHARKIQELTGRSPSQFKQLAEELLELIELNATHGQRPSKVLQFFAAISLQGQRWGTFLALLGIGASLIAGYLPSILPIAKQLLHNDSFWGYVVVWLFIISFFLVAFTFFSYTLKDCWRGIRTWYARIRMEKQGQSIHLEYLLKHLIKLHDPVLTSTEPPCQLPSSQRIHPITAARRRPLHAQKTLRTPKAKLHGATKSA